MRFLIENWFYILIFVTMVYMMFRGGGCCGGDHRNHNEHNDSHSNGGHMDHQRYIENSEIANTDIVKDPVCGMNVSKRNSISRYINGKAYYFCSDNCANKFERNYVKYK